jgi:uncharacterized membrane protein SirB2
MYAGLKHSHMLFITISIVLFQLRFALKSFNKPIAKPLKIIPHINDTLLLITGITMAYQASINPMEHSWLLAKIIALVLYIGLGTVALKSSGIKSKLSYIIATLLFVFMVLTALKKQPILFGL